MTSNPKKHRRWPWVLIFLAGCAFAAIRVIDVNAIFYNPDRVEYGRAEEEGLAFQDHFYTTARGNRIHGRYFRTPELPSKGLVLLFKGNARNITFKYQLYSWVLDYGYDFYIFDYSGFGRSEGKPNQYDTYADGLASLAYVWENLRPEENQKLVVVGVSLGVPILLRTLPDWEPFRENVDLVVLEGGFASYRGMGKARMEELGLGWARGLANLIVDDTMSGRDFIDDIAPVPLLIVHSEGDQTIPIRQSRDILELAEEPKTFWEFGPEYDHVEIFASGETANRERLVEFMEGLGGRDRRDL